MGGSFSCSIRVHFGRWNWQIDEMSTLYVLEMTFHDLAWLKNDQKQTQKAHILPDVALTGGIWTCNCGGTLLFFPLTMSQCTGGVLTPCRKVTPMQQYMQIKSTSFMIIFMHYYHAFSCMHSWRILRSKQSKHGKRLKINRFACSSSHNMHECWIHDRTSPEYRLKHYLCPLSNSPICRLTVHTAFMSEPAFRSSRVICVCPFFTDRASDVYCSCVAEAWDVWDARAACVENVYIQTTLLWKLKWCKYFPTLTLLFSHSFSSELDCERPGPGFKRLSTRQERLTLSCNNVSTQMHLMLYQRLTKCFTTPDLNGTQP